jgi:hypothetical protein
MSDAAAVSAVLLVTATLAAWICGGEEDVVVIWQSVWVVVECFCSCRTERGVRVRQGPTCDCDVAVLDRTCTLHRQLCCTLAAAGCGSGIAYHMRMMQRATTYCKARVSDETTRMTATRPVTATSSYQATSADTKHAGICNQLDTNRYRIRVPWYPAGIRYHWYRIPKSDLNVTNWYPLGIRNHQRYQNFFGEAQQGR